MDKKVLELIDAAQKELNSLIDATYASAKKSGNGYKALGLLGTAAKNLERAAKGVKDATAPVVKAVKK